MAENPLAVVKNLDPELFADVEATRILALSDGVLPAYAESPVRKDRDECEKGTLRRLLVEGRKTTLAMGR